MTTCGVMDMPGPTRLVPAWEVFEKNPPNPYSVNYYRPVYEKLKSLGMPSRLDLLQRVVDRLKLKMPEKNFRGEIRTLYGEKYFVIYRGDKRARESYKEVPLWIRLSDGDLFFPASYVRRNPKLCGFVVSYRLEAIRQMLGMTFPRTKVVIEPKKEEVKVEKKKKEEVKPEKKKEVKKKVKVERVEKKEEVPSVPTPMPMAPAITPRSGKLIVCPKCGQLGTIQRKWKKKNKSGERLFYYCVAHRFKDGGKWRTKWCHLGKKIPEELLQLIS